ncbi:MAG: ribosome maturation factor RimP [Clostridia bacterium]
MKVTDAVFELVKPMVSELGFELYDVEYAKEQAGYVLTVVIDKKDGITLEDCESVSRAIDPILDEKDPIEGSYYLSVSSVGIDRPIKKDKDFERNIGNIIDVKLYAPINKKKEFEGALISFDADYFTLCVKGSDMIFKRKDAALLRPHIDF